MSVMFVSGDLKDINHPLKRHQPLRGYCMYMARAQPVLLSYPVVSSPWDVRGMYEVQTVLYVHTYHVRTAYLPRRYTVQYVAEVQ